MPIHDDLEHLLENQMPFVTYLHARGSLAPLAASMDLEGQITGGAFTVELLEKSCTVDEAIEYFRAKFTREFGERTIRASAIFFHGYLDATGVRVAHEFDEAQMIVAWLQHAKDEESVQAVIRYTARRRPSSELVDVEYEDATFSAISAATPEPLIIFMPRTAPPEGQSTVIRVENDLFDLLKDRLEILEAVRDLHVVAPAVTSVDADGVIWGELPTQEGLGPGESLLGVLNQSFITARRKLDLETITASGVFCFGWIRGNESSFTEKLDEANVLVAWLLHRSQIVEVNIPYTNKPAPGDSPYGSPTGEIIETLPFVSGQRVKWVWRAPPTGASGILSCGIGDHALAIHKGGLVERWNLADGRPIDACSVPYKDLSAGAVSGRCEWYVTGSLDGKAALWRADQRGETRVVPGEGAVTACALDDPGNRALVAFANGSLLFWDLLEERPYWTNHAAAAGALSADGTRALTSSLDDAPALWDFFESEEPAIAYRLRSGQSEVSAVALSADGHAALTSSTDGVTFVWDLALGKARHSLNGPGAVRACALTRDGQFALISHDSLTVLWDAFAGFPLQEIQVEGHHSALAFAADGKSALLGSSDGTLTFMELFPS